MGRDVIFTDFAKALGQLPDPRFRRVLWLGVGLTLALLVASYALVLWGVQALTSGPIVLPGVGEVTWLGDLLSWGSVFVMIVLSVFLMVPVASAITSLFLDDVAAAVEATHYPHLPPVERVPFWEGVRDTVNFLGVLIGANILALLLALMFAWVPFVPFLIFYGLNGYLLGREYFTLAAMRRVGREAAGELRRHHRREVWIAGCLMAVPLTVPLVNLLVPILGAATFTHLFHRLQASPAPGSPSG